jgi:hypothetical protein
MGAERTVAPSQGPSYGPASTGAAALDAEGGGAELELEAKADGEAAPVESARGACWPHATPVAPNASDEMRSASGRTMERCRGTSNAAWGRKTTSLGQKNARELEDHSGRETLGEMLRRGVLEGEPRRSALGEGAAQAAPTAPHATPAPESRKRKRSGPERFWRRRSLRLALGPFVLLSLVAHYVLFPVDLPHGFEVNDVEGEAAIPVEVLNAEPAPPPPPESTPPPAAPDKADEEKARELAAAAAAARADAGAEHDAGAVLDASAQDAGPVDAAPGDAAAEGGAGDAALASAEFDAGPNAIVGAAIQADVNLVTLVVNAEVIRQHPVGARMGFLLRGIPQWDEFMSGTSIDPIRDTDWVQIAGPSLINTARDVVLIHYSAPDAVVDHAVDVVSRKYDRGGRFDAGVPGVRASLAHADRAERVLLRAQPHVLAVVPPGIAEKSARQLVSIRLPAHNHPGEAVYLRLVNPHHPMPEVPESITEMRLRVVPRADLGADVFTEGDTKDAADAAEAADGLRRMVRRHNDAFTAMLTHGLFDHVEVTSEGPLVKAHLVVTLDQIETLTALVAGFLGVQPDVAPPTTSPPARKGPAH